MTWMKRGALALVAVGSVWSAVAVASSGRAAAEPASYGPDPVCADRCRNEYDACIRSGGSFRCEPRYMLCIDQCPHY